ncbi:MAG: hypothetical protein L0Y72_27295 [Gemmataceae bacterium]|nr:hypothetical protein [Gemmataceae bacterium]MCI0742757.1 hypothetical protein [Gemmataceae bacterium]
MRHYKAVLVLLGLLALVSPLAAQDDKKPKFVVQIDKVQLGFRSFDPNAVTGQFKIGMWMPVYVEVTAGLKGVKVDPNDPPYIQIESIDSEDVGTIYRIPVIGMEPLETRTFIGYTKPGHSMQQSELVKVSMYYDGRTYTPRGQVGQPFFELNSAMYLSLGSRIPDMRDALARINRQFVGGDKGGPIMPGQPQGQGFDPGDDPRATGHRYACFEIDPAKLPDHWIGYQSVDLVFLSTDKKEFLSNLLKEANKPRLRALAQWVRRGGRLVIPVHYQTQDLLESILKSPVWQPLVPVIPPALPGDVKATAVKRLTDIENFAGVGLGKPFPAHGADPIPIAKLDPGNVAPGIWEIRAKVTEDGRPLVTRMPYGLGNITFVAFSLDGPPFTQWDGRADFLKTLISLTAPRVSPVAEMNIGGGGRFRGGMGEGGGGDITSELHRQLDNFDVNIVPFGYVALFIILYILVVGPLDYFVLKYVFKKLEWTWITFPAVVLAVSVAAYFTAYALKGNDLKINKVDVIDIDMRSELDGQYQPKRAFAYGHSFFTILSPRIQNYTVGIEPNPAFWAAKSEKPLSADQVSWLGRPEYDGPGAMGRSGTQGFFRRPYRFADDASGIVGVPIPVWTTKSFNASWETSLPSLPFQAALQYPTRQAKLRDVQLTGTIQNNLGVDLEDVWILYGRFWYPITGGLPKGKEPVKVELERKNQEMEMNAWVSRGDGQESGPRDVGFQSVQGQYNPTGLVKQALFYEKFDVGNSTRNFALKPLDQSWRVKEEFNDKQRGGVREAILYARVRFQRGPAETIAAGQSMPTHLWLGGLPLPGETRPTLAGTMAQDTYVRVILPVSPSVEN